MMTFLKKKKSKKISENFDNEILEIIKKTIKDLGAVKIDEKDSFFDPIESKEITFKLDKKIFSLIFDALEGLIIKGDEILVDKFMEKLNYFKQKS